MTRQTARTLLVFICATYILGTAEVVNESNLTAQDKPLRVFIFAGQSNMEGADSKITDVKNFPRYLGLDKPREDVRFSYTLGRQNKKTSDGWVALQSVNDWVGPELSFARLVTGNSDGPIAIIKCAAGGTHLGGDWNPDNPSGFKMYPLALKLVKDSLSKLKEQGIDFRVEAFFWHQGENDMFNEDYKKNYGDNLENFLASWRRDLDLPRLKFFIGELCTKTIWGMDLRPRMYAISLGQKQVTEKDPLATYVRTSHDGVEIGGGVGLHYHYGTLGQLQHGENYAIAYLKSIGKYKKATRTLNKWPYKKGETVNLFVLAGHRNMEGERSFAQELKLLPKHADLLDDNSTVAYKYDLGGGFHKSVGWEPLGLTGYYDTFGPELSFARQLQKQSVNNLAIAKFTHSGSQIIDWTPEGSMAKSRMLYSKFIQFVKDSMNEIKAKGNPVSLNGIVYHVGENDMSFFPYRKDAPKRIESIIKQSRKDLNLPELLWVISQQSPTDHERVNKVDVMANVKNMLENDRYSLHVPITDLPPQKKKLVIDTAGVIDLGEKMATAIHEKVK